jgi:hypothetical protein
MNREKKKQLTRGQKLILLFAYKRGERGIRTEDVEILNAWYNNPNKSVEEMNNLSMLFNKKKLIDVVDGKIVFEDWDGKVRPLPHLVMH